MTRFEKGRTSHLAYRDQFENGEVISTTPAPARPRLSVVIATYDRYNVLPGAIDSLLGQNVPSGFLEIIVVDNSPKREEAKSFAKRYASVRPLRYLLENHPGLSNARNVGTAAAVADIVAFIDDDAIACPEWAREIVAAFEDFPEHTGVVGGRILPRWHSPRPEWLPDDLLAYLSVVDWDLNRGPLPKDKWVGGCNIAFDRTALLDAGGFSCALGRKGSGAMLLSNDELELMERIQAKGFQTIYVPSAMVEHVIDPARLTQSWFRRRAAWQAVSDFVKDPAAAMARARLSNEYLRQVTSGPALRNPLGFYSQSDDAESFRRDVAIAYHVAFAALAGGGELDIKAEVNRSSSVWRKTLSHIRRSLLRQQERQPAAL